MDNSWITTQIPLKYMLSDLVLLSYKLTLKVKNFEIITDYNSIKNIPEPPKVKLSENEQGYLIRSLPLPVKQPIFRSEGEYIYYIPEQYNRFYIDLQKTFDEYINKFSSKTRSTIRRKIKKFSSKCNGNLHWKSYRTCDEMNSYYTEARKVSSKSYQETLLDSGLPDTIDFRKSMENLAKENLVRGYLLFDNKLPVAYMYCPVKDNVLLYQYLGYDHEYIKWSVGTILHWYAFEDIFNEKKFSYFDFTEGHSEHKRLYSTESLLCGNVYIFPKILSKWFLVCSHSAMNLFSETLGNLFDRMGLKSKLKKLIRFKGIK